MSKTLTQLRKEITLDRAATAKRLFKLLRRVARKDRAIVREALADYYTLGLTPEQIDRQLDTWLEDANDLAQLFTLD